MWLKFVIQSYSIEQHLRNCATLKNVSLSWRCGLSGYYFLIGEWSMKRSGQHHQELTSLSRASAAEMFPMSESYLYCLPHLLGASLGLWLEEKMDYWELCWREKDVRRKKQFDLVTENNFWIFSVPSQVYLCLFILAWDHELLEVLFFLDLAF